MVSFFFPPILSNISSSISPSFSPAFSSSGNPCSSSWLVTSIPSSRGSLSLARCKQELQIHKHNSNPWCNYELSWSLIHLWVCIHLILLWGLLKRQGHKRAPQWHLQGWRVWRRGTGTQEGDSLVPETHSPQDYSLLKPSQEPEPEPELESASPGAQQTETAILLPKVRSSSTLSMCVGETCRW